MAAAIAFLTFAACSTPEPSPTPLPPTDLTTSQHVANVAGAPLRWAGAALVYPLKGLFYDLPLALARPSDAARDRARAIAALASPMGGERASAAQRLGELSAAADPSERAGNLDLLVPLLDDPASSVRSAAALALGATAHPRAFTPLALRLKDPDPAVRGSCAIALGRLGDRRAAPLVRDLAASPWGEHWYVQLASIQAGSVLGVSEVGVRARAILDDPPPDAGWLAPAVALIVLGRLDDDSATSVITAHLGPSHSAEVRTAAAFALGDMQSNQELFLQLLARAQTGDDQLPFVLVLERGGARIAREPLVRLLSSPDPRVRAHAAGALVNAYDERGVEGLLAGVQSSSVYERFYCLGRLEGIAGSDTEAGFSERAWREWWRDHRDDVLAAWEPRKLRPFDPARPGE